MSAINNFLLVFDHSKNELKVCEEFGTDTERATLAYADMERRYRETHFMDIVLVGSDSIETVKVTHSTYFKNGSRALVERSLRQPLEF